MHSNDARGATITEDPTDPTTKLSASTLLVRTKGAELGVRSKIVPGLDTSLSLLLLDQDSEIVFSGDAGDTEASCASRRLRHDLWEPGAGNRLRRPGGREVTRVPTAKAT